MEDDLLRLFGSERIQGIMEKLGMEEGESIEHPLLTKAIANAQKKVEQMHFDIRRQLLMYDNVMNQQREAVYAEWEPGRFSKEAFWSGRKRLSPTPSPVCWKNPSRSREKPSPGRRR